MTRTAVAFAGLALWTVASGGRDQQPPPDLVGPGIEKALSDANGGARVVLQRPALALDPWMDTTAAASREALSNVLDMAFDGEPLRANGGRLSSAYFEILDRAEWATSSLNLDQRRRLAAVAKILFSDAARTVPTPAYRTYRDFKRALDDLQRQWDETPPDQRSASLSTDLENARADLVLHDEEGKYSTAEATYESLTNRPPPSARRALLRQRYDAAMLAGGDGRRFAPSDLGASYAATVQGDTWTRLEITNASNGGAPLGLVWGRIGTDGAIAVSPSRATRFAVAISVAAVPIVRPWFDATLFADRFWRWTDPAHAPIADPTRPAGSRGTVPSFATHALVVTDIVIDSNLPSAEWTAVQHAVLQEETLTWGPFLVSGRYFDPLHRRLAARRVGTTLVIPDVQIIGWLVEAVPKSPDPDLRLEWPVPANVRSNPK